MKSGLPAVTLALLVAASNAAFAQDEPQSEETWLGGGGSQCWGANSADGVGGPTPASDDEARAIAWDRRHDLTPLCLYEAASWWALVDLEKGAELFALAMIRARYDVFRCRRPDEAQNAPSLFQTTELTLASAFRERREAEPSWWPGVLARVAADDATFAYDGRRLSVVCADAGGPAPRRRWGDARDRVREALASASAAR